jgi:hypothetical protein
MVTLYAPAEPRDAEDATFARLTVACSEVFVVQPFVRDAEDDIARIGEV